MKYRTVAADPLGRRAGDARSARAVGQALALVLRRLIGAAVVTIALGTATPSEASADTLTVPTERAGEVAALSPSPECLVQSGATSLVCAARSSEPAANGAGSGGDSDWLLSVAQVMRFGPQLLAVLWLLLFVHGLLAAGERGPARIVAVEWAAAGDGRRGVRRRGSRSSATVVCRTR